MPGNRYWNCPTRGRQTLPPVKKKISCIFDEMNVGYAFIPAYWGSGKTIACPIGR